MAALVFDGLQFGVEVVWRELTMVPLVGPDVPAAAYVTLDEALATGSVRITEVSNHGRVPELQVVNDADAPVLIADGEELVGAKQNRIVNLTILVPARTRLTIPVSCVEAGRWQWRSRTFEAAPRLHHAAGRAMKMAQVTASLAERGERGADQLAIWEDVAAKAARLEASSPTAASEAMYRSHEEALAAAVAALAPADGQRGAVFVLEGRAVGVELFDAAATWRKLAPKFARSYALDALDAEFARRRGFAAPLPARGAESLRAATDELLRRVAAAPEKRFPAIGLGEDIRLAGENVAGGALVVGGRLVHLSAFAR
jgi:hypothetical protein